VLLRLTALRDLARTRLQTTKDMLGFNRAGMQYLKREIEYQTSSHFFDEAMQSFQANKKAKK
jgi:hypothetical protein